MNADQIWAGLLLRGLSNKNQFIEIFINVVLPDKSQSYLCKIYLIYRNTINNNIRNVFITKTNK